MPEKLGRCYWLPASIPLTSTANEVQYATTPEAKADLQIVGGATNLTVSSFKARDIGGGLLLANDYLPILSQFGKRDSARPVHYYPTPIPLGFGNRIELEVKNAASGAEAAGSVVFVAIPDEPAHGEVELVGRGHPSGFFVNANFTGSANDHTTRQSPELDSDFVICGAYTDLASATLRITGIYAEAWMTEFVPVWALAGRRTADVPALMWPRKYLIKRGSTITVDFKNPGAEAAGLGVYFVGQKL